MAGGFAYIWNLGVAGLWTAGGTDAKPRLEFAGTDVDAGSSIAGYKVRIYNASTANGTDTAAGEGGAPTGSGGTRVYYSGEVSAANPTYHDAGDEAAGFPAFGMLNRDQASNERWWTVAVKDNLGEWSAESSRTAFKVDWSQAIYQHNIGVGAGSLTFNADPNAGANTQQAFIFANADVDGTNRIAPWQTTIGAVPNTKAYLNILVRLATNSVTGNGVQPSLPAMRIAWQVAAQYPDNWSRNPSGAWALDTDNRRYGSKAFKCVVGSAAYHWVESFRTVSSPIDGVEVAPDTDYVFSAFIKTNAPLTSTHVVRLEVRALDPTAFAAGDIKHGLVTGDEYNDGPGATQDSALFSEKWQRIHLHYHTGPTEQFVRPIVLYTKSDGTTPANTGDVFWVDAVKWEEGTVVSAWTPGFMSPALVADSYGLQVNSASGGKLSLQATDSGVNVSTDIGSLVRVHSGAGTPEGVLAAPIGHLYLRTDGSTSTTLYIKTSGTGNTGWTAK